jgi:hypothetical protein
MSKNSTSSADQSSEDPIRATLAVEPSPDANCVILEEGVRVDVIDQNLTFDFASPSERMENGKCHTNVADTNDGVFSDSYVSSEVTNSCFCLVFHEIDSVPRIQRVEGNKIIVTVLVPDRATLRELIERLRATDASVSVYRITRTNADKEESIVIDVTDVTEKQRQALQVAIDAGYYETPRRADLEDLSEQLGISKSAVSQRLKAVESRLVHKLADESPE